MHAFAATHVVIILCYRYILIHAHIYQLSNSRYICMYAPVCDKPRTLLTFFMLLSFCGNYCVLSRFFFPVAVCLAVITATAIDVVHVTLTDMKVSSLRYLTCGFQRVFHR